MKSKIKKSLGTLSKKVTTADKIPEKPVFDEEKINKRIKELEWVSQIEAYCGEIGILPNDLIETHRQSLKIPKMGKKEGKDEQIKEVKKVVSNWFNDYRYKKTGHNFNK